MATAVSNQKATRLNEPVIPLLTGTLATAGLTPRAPSLDPQLFLPSWLGHAASSCPQQPNVRGHRPERATRAPARCTAWFGKRSSSDFDLDDLHRNSKLFRDGVMASDLFRRQTVTGPFDLGEPVTLCLR